MKSIISLLSPFSLCRRLVVLLLSFLVCTISNANAGESIDLALENVYVPGLLRALAKGAKRELILSGYALNRISMSKSYRDYDSAIFDVVSRLGAQMEVIDGITVIYPPCNPPRHRMRSIQVKPEKLNLNFDRIQISELLHIFGDFHSLQLREQPHRERLRGRSVGILVVNRNTASTLKVLAAATGVGIEGSSNGGYVWIQDPDPDPSCADSSAPQAELSFLQSQEVSTAEPCPRKQYPGLQNIVCGPLEFLDLDALIPRGYISVSEGFIALLESPAGATVEIRERDYVGHYYGVVKSVDSTGFTVEEIRSDLLDLYYRRTTQISYKNERRSTADSDMPRHMPGPSVGGAGLRRSPLITH